MLNVLAYADDIVLLAPSWKALQFLLDLLDSLAADIDMLCIIRINVKTFSLKQSVRAVRSYI